MTREFKSLKQCLDRLRLKTVAENWDTIATEMTNISQDTEEFLVRLLKAEIDRRDTNLQNRRLVSAKFSGYKTIENFDFNEIKSLDKNLILQLREGSYIQENMNIMFVGDIGTGKTHLSIDFGLQACRLKYSVKFYKAIDLANILLEQANHNNIQNYISYLSKIDLLILDGFASIPFSKIAADYLFQIIENRYEKKSTIVSTNVALDQWVSTFNFSSPITNLLDHLIHHCHIINMNEESFRVKQQLRKLKTAR